MDQTIQEKVKILADSAKYDVSCSSSGVRRNVPGGMGNTALGGICHSFTEDGRCISLLKILQTNICIYDCVYCVNRKSNDIPRACFTSQELADLTLSLYKRNCIEGLFLSSAIIKDPDTTMELMLGTIQKLRNECQFHGYIHMKVIPGASSFLIDKAGAYADRVSVNIELPTKESLALLAPDKTKHTIFTPMQRIHQKIQEGRALAKTTQTLSRFAPAGQSTQLIVGASPETDYQILHLSEYLYQTMKLKRVYYSAFVPVTAHKNLPAIVHPPLVREHRLYQADWLLRFYGFRADEIVDERYPQLEEALDPKAGWALRHLDQFPIEVNRADYQMLLRVPGLGVRSAQRIVKARRVALLCFEDLKKLGVVIKRARFFLTINGKYYGQHSLHQGKMHIQLIQDEGTQPLLERQLEFFDQMQFVQKDAESVITGEL